MSLVEGARPEGDVETDETNALGRKYIFSNKSKKKSPKTKE